MAANHGQGGDLKWQVLVNRLPVVVSILENPSTERKVAPASLENLEKLHDQAQALLKGQLVLPVTLDEAQRKEVDECVAGIARCLDKFPLHLLLEASQPKRAKVPLDVPATPGDDPTPLQRTSSLPTPGGPPTVVVPTSKSEGLADKFCLGFSPPRSKLAVRADRGVEEVGLRPPEKFQKGFVPKHSDTGTTGLTTEVPAPDGVVLHPPPMHGSIARPVGAFGGLGVASKPAFYPPGRNVSAEGGLEKDNGHARKLEQPAASRPRGFDLADPGGLFARSPPKSSVLSGGRAGHEEFWGNGWTTIASRDLRAEMATAELDLLKESDEARAVRVRTEREAEAAAKIVWAREARQLYAGLDDGSERMQIQRGGAQAGAQSPPRKESSSQSAENSPGLHSSGAEADVDSQGLPGGYTDSGDKLALAGGDQRQNSFQSPRGRPSQGGALSPAARHRQKQHFSQRQLEEEGPHLELRVANGDHRTGAPKSARVPLGLSLWCGSGIEGGQDNADGGSGSGQEDGDPSPQSPLAEKGNNINGRRDWPEVGVLANDEQHRKRGMVLEAERSTPSPPVSVSLGLALQAGGRHKRVSNTDTLNGSVGQPLGSVGFACLDLGTSRETSEVERGVKRHQGWQEDAWGRSAGVAGQLHQHFLNSPPEEERRKAGAREQAKRPRVEPPSGDLSPPPPRAAKAPQKARGFDYPAALRSSVEAFLAQSSSGVSHEVGGRKNPSPPLWPPPERAAKLPPPFTQQELVQRGPPSRRIVRPTPPAVRMPEYPLLPPHLLNRGVPEIPLQGVPVYPQLFRGASDAPSKAPPYPRVPLDPTVYPFGAVRAVPASPYGAMPPDWAAPFPPHVFAAGFDQKARVFGGPNHGIVNPLGKALQPSWAEAVSRWQLPHERNRGVPEEALAEEARSQSQSWPKSTPIAPGTSLQGVHSRPNSAPVHFSRGRKDPPSARGYYETHPEIFSLGRDQPPTTFPHRGTNPQGERPAKLRTDGDISSLMPSLDLNQPPPLYEGGKLVSPSGDYLDPDPHPPVSRTRGQPGFAPPLYPHIAYPETPYAVELPVTEPSNLSPPPYGKPRGPPAFPTAHDSHIPYPLSVPPPRAAPDSSLYSNVHDPPIMDPGSFVLPVAYDYGALERPESFAPRLQKLGYPRPPQLVAPVGYDPGQIAYDRARHPVPLHLQGAYPIPDPRSLNPSDPRAHGFFPVSWAADARVQGVKTSALQGPPDAKDLVWGDPHEIAAGFARRGRAARQYVAADKETVAAREKVCAMQAPMGIPPPVPAPPAAFANYPTWDLRAAPMLPFGRNLGLACDSSVASNVIRRTDSENDLSVLPSRGDEARVPTRNESLEEIAYARRRDVGSPVGDAVLGKAPLRSSRGAAHLTRLGEDPRGGLFVAEERFPRQYMQEQYLRGVEEGAKAAQWQRKCGLPQSLDVPAEPYAEEIVNRAVPSVSGTGVIKAGRHPEVRKKRSSDEATSKNSGEPETEQPLKKRSPNARTHAIGLRGLGLL